MTEKESPSVVIVGAGIAGLSAGVYAQANGFKTRIIEMHTMPGGLMTAWKRKGYTIDGCIHWLSGSREGSSLFQQWQEIGLIQGLEIYDPEVFLRFESKDGKVLKMYSDVNRLEKHLLELAPEDAVAIRAMCRDIRLFANMSLPPIHSAGDIFRFLGALPKAALAFPRVGKIVKMNSQQYAAQFKNDFLRQTFSEMWMGNMSAIALLMTMAMLHRREAGYPIGGSVPMARAVEKRFCQLGGEIEYNTRVEKIIVENGQAVGVLLADGREVRADYVISGADGYATIFKMLDGKYVSEETKAIYQKGEIFPPILFIGLGVDQKIDDPELYGITGGISFPIDDPIEIAGEPVKQMDAMIYNFDPTLSPEGKTVITLMQPTSYTYWKELAEEPERYQAEKERVALEYIKRLDVRFPGFSERVEMADVATPVTFERYTGNWQGSFEGWLPTPGMIMKRISKTLPGLENFYMVGQWVQAGGGLPSGVMTGRQVVQMICKKEGKKFRSQA